MALFSFSTESETCQNEHALIHAGTTTCITYSDNISFRIERRIDFYFESSPLIFIQGAGGTFLHFIDRKPLCVIVEPPDTRIHIVGSSKIRLRMMGAGERPPQCFFVGKVDRR